jgi:hypothetical protein
MVKSALPIMAFASLAVTLASANNAYTPVGGTCRGYYKPCVSGTTCKTGKCTQEGIEAGLACGVCKICKTGLDCKGGNWAAMIGKCCEKCGAAPLRQRMSRGLSAKIERASSLWEQGPIVVPAKCTPSGLRATATVKLVSAHTVTI